MAKARWLATLLLFPLVQCSENSITSPDIPDSARANAIRLHVDLAAKTVSQIGVAAGSGISYSLVGSDAITVQSTTPVQTSISNRKNLVRFDVAIVNTLSNVTLIHATQPTPPAGTTGLLLFAFQAAATSGSGAIVPSSDWDGPASNFFNDASCKNSQGSDCYPYEEYPAPLAAGATSSARTIGFEVDKSVTAFDVVMLLSADLQNVAQAPPSLVLSQTTANFVASAGTIAPFPIAITMSNGGGGTLGAFSTTVTYQSGQPTGWLTADINNITAPNVLGLYPSTSGLSDGTYNATVAVSSAGVSNSPQNVAVTLVVSGSAPPTAIYVSQSDPSAANDATCGLGPTFTGSGNHPCLTIAQGLARASAVARNEIRVADGHYTEAVTLVNGKNLLGGYQPDTWQRHVASTNTVIDGVSSSGNNDYTIIATGITSPTVFEGFVVRGAANSKASGNSYAMYISNSGGLTISRNLIYAGSGGPGTQGASGSTGAPGADGAGRESNPAGYDAKIATGTGKCDSSNDRTYANGAVASVGADNVSGGNGGGNTCPPSSTYTQQSAHNGLEGMAGDGALGGAAGSAGSGGFDYTLEIQGLNQTCYLPTPTTAGIPGAGGAGGNGQNAPAVAGGSSADGSVVAGQWIGSSGNSGISGGNGGGGGGGGAGAGAFTVTTGSQHDQLGGVGGGGGAGGAGGGGGGAGTAGGGSFGIFIIGTAPVVTDNSIVRGNGGAGGGGGAGAPGALGGQGGNGGEVPAPLFCPEPGARGGNGGMGGIGSGGGGGSGGASFGIYTSGAGTPTYCTSGDKNTITGGAAGNGGQGGASPGNPGGSGVAGTLASCSFH